jgi:hypothetical protein
LAAVEACRYGTLVAQMDELSTMEKPRAFVFAVCGSAQHIARFHQAAEILAIKTSHPIWVVTDVQRNELELQHDRILDVRIPATLDNHQASIFLKTSLYRHLPQGTIYCYLDTDVIALSSNCDLVFDAFHAPVTFAPDFVQMDIFSRFAVNCVCEAQLKKAFESHNLATERYAATLAKEYNAACQEIDMLTEKNKRTMFQRIITWTKYHLSSSPYYVLNEAYKQEKSTDRWTGRDGVPLEEKYDRIRFLEREMGLPWDAAQQYFILNGAPLGSYTCQHLNNAIAQKFGIDSIPYNWQHWNGGVFLFDESAYSFMEFWHNASLAIMEDNAWKVRDQGTLAATAWHFGLQQHAMLDIKFNRIIDLSAQHTVVMEDGTLMVNGEKEYPALLHALGLDTYGLQGINALIGK